MPTKTKRLNEADAHLLLFGIMREALEKTFRTLTLYDFIVRAKAPDVMPKEMDGLFDRYGDYESDPRKEGPSWTFLVLDYLWRKKLLGMEGSSFDFTEVGRKKFARLREGLDLQRLEELASSLY